MLQARAGLLIAAVILSSIACQKTRPGGLPTVYAGPSLLPLQSDKGPNSKVTGKVPHGERLYVVERWRKLYRVRTEAGLEGWTHERELMSSDQMDELRKLEQSARRLPSQGVGTTYDLLNLHTEPRRRSPAFVQVKAGEKFDILRHDTSPRADTDRRILIKPRPRPIVVKRSDRKKKIQPPPPAPPKPPDDWEELSRLRPVPKDEDDDAPPVPTDDWTLIRNSGGTVGWVLTNRVYMAIPDEVAQYAEGHRIVSYFVLGSVHDEELDADKKFWLWTTIRSGRQPYDFDGFRVFTWNPRRHRYETAYIQRRIEGFLPVLLEKHEGQMTFSICLAQEDGTRVRKQFVLVDRLIRSAGEVPCRAGDELLADAQPPGATDASSGDKSLSDRLKQKAGELKSRVLGR